MTETDAERDARWVSYLVICAIFLSRISVPGLPVSVLLPVTILWALLGLRKEILTLNHVRSLWWCGAALFTGTIVLVQSAASKAPIISVPSWALFMVTWASTTVKVENPTWLTLWHVMERVLHAGWVFVVLVISMTATQLAGLEWHDLLKVVLPDAFVLDGYVTTYPIYYGSDIMRSNGWVGLEASTSSFALGMLLLFAFLLRKPLWQSTLILVAMVCTAAGSGFLIVLVGVTIILLSSCRVTLLKQVPLVLIAALIAATPYGSVIFSRTTEASQSNSSTSLRAIEPYLELWPRWAADMTVTLLGKGPGSAQEYADASGVSGLLVPTPAKVFFEYGLLAGMVLLIFLLSTYSGSPSRVLSGAMFISLWTIQPGSTSAYFAIWVTGLVSSLSPRRSVRLETIRYPLSTVYRYRSRSRDDLEPV